MSAAASANSPRRFRYNDKTYTVPAFNDIALKEIIQFDQQAAALGIDTRWDDIEELARMSGAMTQAQAASHPLRYIMFATTIWFARRSAGEDVTLEETTEIKLSEIEFIPDPKDRQPGKKAAKKATTRKRATSKGSAAAAADVAGSPSHLVEDAAPAT